MCSLARFYRAALWFMRWIRGFRADRHGWKAKEINLRPGGELLMLVNHLDKQHRTDNVNRKLDTLSAPRTRELFLPSWSGSVPDSSEPNASGRRRVGFAFTLQTNDPTRTVHVRFAVCTLRLLRDRLRPNYMSLTRGIYHVFRVMCQLYHVLITC